MGGRDAGYEQTDLELGNAVSEGRAALQQNDHTVLLDGLQLSARLGPDRAFLCESSVHLKPEPALDTHSNAPPQRQPRRPPPPSFLPPPQIDKFHSISTPNPDIQTSIPPPHYFLWSHILPTTSFICPLSLQYLHPSFLPIHPACRQVKTPRVCHTANTRLERDSTAMFYSHEILASPKHGVATVWLIANLGHNANSRKLTRKAIESVNVPQACSTIEKPPGAPIALRLQGSLLYGVSGAYHKHGAYLLNDVEKMWACMRAYFRDMRYSGSDTIDQNAGKAKRNQIVLGDDPSFVPDPTLPPLDFDDNGDLVLPILDISQKSQLYSQFSPVDRGSNSVEKAPFINLDFRNSSSHASLGFGMPFGKGNQNLEEGSMFQMAFGGEEELPFADFPIRIDADGNLIEEPELPVHLEQDVSAGAQQLQKNGDMAHLPDDDDGAIVMFGDDKAQISMVDGAPGNPQPSKNVSRLSEDPLSSDPARQARPRQKKRQIRAKKNKALVFDAATHISRPEFKAWGDNYLIRMTEAQEGPRKITKSQAQQNAYGLLFGKGLGNIGAISSLVGVSHELAGVFAGEALQEIVMSDMLAILHEEGLEDARVSHQRRSASIAFGSDDEHNNENNRRVRPRVEGDDSNQGSGNTRQGAQIVDDPLVMFDDDGLEFGRDQPGSALSDHRHSSNVPWNRPSSLIPSSARSGRVEGGRNTVQSSPLISRGSVLQKADAHFDDGGVMMPGSEDFESMQHDGALELSSLHEAGQQDASTSQLIRKTLDREGRNFLGFIECVAAEHGDKDQANEDLRWIGFDKIFEAQDQTRAVVAQAFLHLLTLVTKNQIRVKQEGVARNEAFGEISVGVLPPLNAD
ncbi:Rec8 like protein-domain-containing protein [Coniella lustricola]|uniref:Rec8 like protein-domain-containing protein n=1 Tax=Coniella lustricola TaxID=2025994 RepID=A0A2T3A6L6_9PEZI|nr:Rec8 like protein-domain-containing protein [Coniella lustricola]